MTEKIVGPGLTQRLTKIDTRSIFLDLSSSKFDGEARVFIFGVKGNGESKLCTNRGEYFLVRSGKQYVLYNSVFEDGCRSCYLDIVVNGKVDGYWDANCADNKRGELMTHGRSLSPAYGACACVVDRELDAFSSGKGRWDTVPLGKGTASYVYLRLIGDDSFKVQVIGQKAGKDQECSEWYDVRGGFKYFITNFVFEKGCSSAYLRFSSVMRPIGQWSSDSVPEQSCVILTRSKGTNQGTKDTKDELFKVSESTRDTAVRNKGTSTSIYLNLTKSSFKDSVRVSIIGCGDETEVNCTNRSEFFEVHAGKKYLLYNKVHENGFRRTKLRFSDMGDRVVEGVWSPDSCPEAGCIEINGSEKNTSQSLLHFTGASDYITELKWKGTNASVYLDLSESSFSESIHVSIIGVTNGKEENCTNRCAAFALEAGKKYELYNIIHERGHSQVALRFATEPSQVIVGKWSPDYTAMPGVIVINGRDPPSERDISDAVKFVKVPYVNQLDVSAGCESASAVMILQYYGLSISVHEFISRCLDVRSWTMKGGRMLAADPDVVFVGDPYKRSGLNCGFGCFSPCIANAMNRVFGIRYLAISEQGTPLDDVVRKYVDDGKPVLLWATINMKPVPTAYSTWEIDFPPEKKGRHHKWKRGEHCLVLVGYNKNNYIFSDPWQSNGVVTFRKDLVETAYNDMGRHIVHVLDRVDIRLAKIVDELTGEADDVDSIMLAKMNSFINGVFPCVKLTYEKSFELNIPGVADVTITCKHAVKKRDCDHYHSIKVTSGKMEPDYGCSFSLGDNSVNFKVDEDKIDLGLGPKWLQLGLPIDLKGNGDTFNNMLSNLSLSIGDGVLKAGYNMKKGAFIITVEFESPILKSGKYTSTIEIEIVPFGRKKPRASWLPSQQALHMMKGLAIAALIVAAVAFAFVFAPEIALGAAAVCGVLTAVRSPIACPAMMAIVASCNGIYG